MYILDEKLLENITAGTEIVSSENKVSNVINFYLNLLPGVSKKHIRVKYEFSNWESKSDNEKYRNVIQKAEINDMKWKELSRSEKYGVISAPLATLLTIGGVSLFSFMRWITK